MSKLVKGLAVSTLAASIALVYGVGGVSAGADHGDYKRHMQNKGSYSSNDLHFNERYDKASSYFFNLKEDEKNDSSEHFSYSNATWDDGRHDDKKHGDKKHGDWHKGGWGHQGRGSSVSIDYRRDDSHSKSLEKKEAASSKESYSSDLAQSSSRGDYGGWGKGASYSNNSVHASANFNKEYDYAASVKAEVASSSSVSTNTSLANYGHGNSYNNSVSAYENSDYYSKVEASIAESQKQQSAVTYSADNSTANFGGHGGANLASSSLNYSANSSSESSREVNYSAVENSSYSSGFSSNNSANQGSWGHKDDAHKMEYAH